MLMNLHEYSYIGLFILRVAVASSFLVHGLQKRAMWKMKASEEMPTPMLGIMRLLSIVEPLGALALIAGFLTQIVTAGFAVIMLGAIFFKAVQMKKKYSEAGGWEVDVLLLAASILLLFIGAGPLSVDFMML